MNTTKTVNASTLDNPQGFTHARIISNSCAWVVRLDELQSFTDCARGPHRWTLTTLTARMLTMDSMLAAAQRAYDADVKAGHTLRQPRPSRWLGVRLERRA